MKTPANLITGVRASVVYRKNLIRAGDRETGYARTFCEVEPGDAFWYRNSLGLVKLAVNQGRAERTLRLTEFCRSGGMDRRRSGLSLLLEHSFGHGIYFVR